MPDDALLLRRYAETRAEDAFAALVRRHIDGVYSAALRRVGGDAHLAEDVAQQVFVALARKATALAGHPALTVWLYVTTRHEAANVVRRERRRKVREQEAQIMQQLSSEGESSADWSRVAPVLDAAIDELGDTDRTAVLLRFVDRRGFADVGAVLKVSEDAARMRVERALGKLHALLARRGVTSTSAALAVALTEQATIAAPAGTAASVTSAALAGTVTSGVLAGAAAAGATSVVTGAAAFMSVTKFGFGLAGVAVLAGALGLAVNEHRARRMAEAAVVSASRDYDLARERWRVGEQRAQAGAPDPARALAAGGAPTGRAMSAAAIAAETKAVNELVRSNAKASGDLLMARHPEVKQAFLDWEAAQLNRAYLSLYRTLNLSPAQIEEFQALHRGNFPMHMETESSSGGITDVEEAIELQVSSGLEPGQMEARLRELLGAEGYRTFGEHQRMRGARDYTAQLAEALSFSSAPLTTDQAKQMADIIDRYSTGETTRRPKFDWNAIEAAAKGILTPGQLPALGSVRAEDRYLQTLGPASEPSREPQP